MPQGDVEEPGVPGFPRGVENDADVHHDVDEQRIFRNEGTQVRALLAEAQRQRAARLNQNGAQGRIGGQRVPAAVGGGEQESEVVHVAVELARLQAPGVPLGRRAPGFVAARAQYPHDARQKPVAPVGPRRPVVLPLALLGVDRVEPRIRLRQRADLPLGKLQRLLEETTVDFRFELDHGADSPRTSSVRQTTV